MALQYLGKNRLTKRTLVIALSTILVFSLGSNPSRANDTPNRHLIMDSFAEGASNSSEIFALPDSQVENIMNDVETNYLPLRKFCETLDSEACAGKTGLSLRLFLPVCSSTLTSLCIQALEVSQDQNSPLVVAKYLANEDGRTYPANAARGTPEGSTPSIWQVPGVKNSGGSDRYLVKVLLDAFITSEGKKLFIFDLNALVDGDSKLLASQRVALTLRIPSTLTGWLNGRLTDPKILVSQIDGTQNQIRVEANPVTVPEVDITLTPEQKAALPDPNFFDRQGQSWNSVNAGNPVAMEWIKQLSGVMKNTSSGEHTSWFFSTVGARRGNACLSDKSRVIGLVTTNSAVYAPGAPDFDGGFLNYKVGGLHYKADGKTLNVGTYDLLIRSDVARCLYNFTNAPLSATVSISYEEGEKQVGTSTLSEKDGWLHLGAYGFTFSNPTLKVKLKGVSASSKSSPQANPSPSSQQKSQSGFTVTCVKGNTVKKIIAAKPMCPSGWKKK